MSIPMALADYIAKVCDLPSLFVGESKGLEINYIWIIAYEDAWHSPIKSTILINSNKWMRGLNYNWIDNASSQMVDLSDYEDNVFKLLKSQEEFQSSKYVLDGYILSIELYEKHEVKAISIYNPYGKASLELEADFERIHRLIHNKSAHNQIVIAPAVSIDNYMGDFLRFIEFTKIFGLSPTFEESSVLLPFEYIFHVTLNGDPQFVFVKTLSDFFGTRFRRQHRGEEIKRLPDNSINWKQLINEPQIEGENGVDTIVKVVLYLKGETLGTNLKKPWKREEFSSLWSALYPLMELLNKE